MRYVGLREYVCLLDWFTLLKYFDRYLIFTTCWIYNFRRQLWNFITHLSLHTQTISKNNIFQTFAWHSLYQNKFHWTTHSFFQLQQTWIVCLQQWHGALGLREKMFPNGRDPPHVTAVTPTWQKKHLLNFKIVIY